MDGGLLIRVMDRSTSSFTVEDADERRRKWTKELELRPHERGLSTYEAADLDDADELAVLHTVTYDELRRVGYVVIPLTIISGVAGLSVEATPTGGNPRLSDAHRELLGLDAPERLEALIDALVGLDTAEIIKRQHSRTEARAIMARIERESAPHQEG